MPLNPAITLQPHQEALRSEAAQAAASGQPFSKLLLWRVGSGKTLGALAAADALGGGGVISPAAIRPTIRQEANQYLGDSRYPVISYQQAANQPGFSPETLIVDECFPAGTMIDGMPIEAYKGGEPIRCVDHSTNRVVVSYVMRVASRTTETIAELKLTNGDALVCTPNHPVFTQRGYVPVELLQPNDWVYRLTSLVGTNGQHEDGNPQLSGVRSYVYCMDEAATEARTKVLWTRLSEGGVGCGYAQGAYTPYDQDCYADDDQQPHEESGYSREDAQFDHRDGSRAASTWREWKGPDATGTSDGVGVRLADVCCGGYSGLSYARESIGQALQDRCWRRGIQNCCGDRRALTFGTVATSPGCKEDRVSRAARVACVTIYKQGGGCRFRELCPSGVVYDLTVAEHHNFLVNGYVVHNSQRIGSRNSTQAQAVLEKARAARNVLLLSGTPVRNHPSEMAPLISALTGKDLSHDEFNRRFIGTERIRPGGIIGWLKGVPTVEQPTLKNTDDLKALLAGKVDYYENATPPPGAPNSVKYEDVEVELTPRQSQLYGAIMGRLDPITRWKLKWNYPLSDEELQRTRSFMAGPRQLALSDRGFRPDRDPYRAFQNSGKLQAAFERLKTRLTDPRAKAIVYSNFPEAGLVPYASALAKEKIPHAIFHGGLSDPERNKLVSDFNAGNIRTALVGPAGAEGLSLNGSQLIQLLDNHWNKARTDQATARGIRFSSHLGLPDDLRDVTVERYIAKLPLSMKDRVLSRLGLIDPEPRQRSVDHYLQGLSDRKQVLNDQMLALLKEVGSHNRAVKSAAERINAGDALRLLKLACTMRPVRDDADDPADREECPHCDAMHERGNGYCNRCGEPWPAVTKKAEYVISTRIDREPGKQDLNRIDAHSAGKNVGYLTSHPGSDGDYIWLKGLYVNPTHRGHGLAGRLLDLAIAQNPSSELRLRPRPYKDKPLDSDALSAFYTRRGFEPYDADGRMVRKVAVSPIPNVSLHEQLRLAKAYSDLGTPEAYQTKVNLLRDAIQKDPTGWVIDSDQGYTKGITHVSSGWRYHLPTATFADLAPMMGRLPQRKP